MKCLNFVSVFGQILVDDVVFHGKAHLEIAKLEIYSCKCQRHYLNKFERIYFSLHRREREGEWFLNCPIPLKNCSDLPEGRAESTGGSSHLTHRAAKANRCSWAGECCHVPQGPSSMAWDGLCTLGWFICEPGAAFVSAQIGAFMQRNSPVCLEQGPLQDAVLVFSRNKGGFAFCVQRQSMSFCCISGFYANISLLSVLLFSENNILITMK